jgi:hypothetical protein
VAAGVIAGAAAVAGAGEPSLLESDFLQAALINSSNETLST